MRGNRPESCPPTDPAIFLPTRSPRMGSGTALSGQPWRRLEGAGLNFRITAVSPRRTPDGNGSSRWESSRVRVGVFTWRKEMRPSLSGNSAATVGQAMRVRLSRRKWTRPTVGARITYAPQFEHPKVAEIRISKNRREPTFSLLPSPGASYGFVASEQLPTIPQNSLETLFSLGCGPTFAVA